MPSLPFRKCQEHLCVAAHNDCWHCGANGNAPRTRRCSECNQDVCAGQGFTLRVRDRGKIRTVRVHLSCLGRVLDRMELVNCDNELEI